LSARYYSKREFAKYAGVSPDTIIRNVKLLETLGIENDT